MRQTILMGIFLMAAISVCCQSVSDSIKLKEGSGRVFQQNGENLTTRQLMTITESNAEAHEKMQQAKNDYYSGRYFGAAGVLLVGWQFGSAIIKSEVNLTLAGVGAALIATGFSFDSASKKHAQKAVRIYNSGLDQSAANKTELNIGLTSHGVGLTVSF
ncbi:MAG: hypothetical protein K9I47_12100 [Bacteroidales bacterium]|nr:hypothetical protein [Bacteroidales bacterium]